eukprot:scaffold5143_cov139-Skeletonema_marinoi.AAC.16
MATIASYLRFYVKSTAIPSQTPRHKQHNIMNVIIFTRCGCFMLPQERERGGQRERARGAGLFMFNKEEYRNVQSWMVLSTSSRTNILIKTGYLPNLKLLVLQQLISLCDFKSFQTEIATTIHSSSHIRRRYP